MKILIDNGHGIETAGKQSPDGLFREYRFNREMAATVVEELRNSCLLYTSPSPRD